jgi:hypothetical protein
LWWPGDEITGLLVTDVSRAVVVGLTFGPLAEMARDTPDWARIRPDDHQWRADLSAERERELLEGWEEVRRWPPIT